MSTITGVESSIFGLMVDLLNKIRHGHIAIEQLRWWVSLTRAQRETIMKLPERIPCYKAHNGEMVPTPEGIEDKFLFYRNLATISHDGKRFAVLAFSPKAECSFDCALAFLAAMGATLAGVWGRDALAEIGINKMFPSHQERTHNRYLSFNGPNRGGSVYGFETLFIHCWSISFIEEPDEDGMMGPNDKLLCFIEIEKE